MRDGQVLTISEMRDKQHRSVRGYKKRMKTGSAETSTLADLIIKNNYRTLMTREVKGCYIYCSDERAAQHFRNRAHAFNLRKPLQHLNW